MRSARKAEMERRRRACHPNRKAHNASRTWPDVIRPIWRRTGEPSSQDLFAEGRLDKLREDAREACVIDRGGAASRHTSASAGLTGVWGRLKLEVGCVNSVVHRPTVVLPGLKVRGSSKSVKRM